MSTLAGKADKSNRKTFKAHDRPSFECIALLLQGGGALPRPAVDRPVSSTAAGGGKPSLAQAA
jgi:hypothetical protein